MSVDADGTAAGAVPGLLERLAPALHGDGRSALWRLARTQEPTLGVGASASGLPAVGRASISATTLPSDSESPTLTLISFTTPAIGAGTSIVALSDSSVTRPWSFFTVSPTATSSLITGTPV